METTSALVLAASEPVQHRATVAATPVSEYGTMHDSEQPASPPEGLLVPIAVEEFIAAAIMAVLALITLVNVLTRYVVDVSLAFTEEYSIVLLMALVFVGVSSAIARGTHIRMTFFVERLSSKAQLVLEVIGQACTLSCFATLAYYGCKITLDAYQLGEASAGLGNPQWMYLVWLPLLSLVAALRAAGLIVRLVRGTVGN